MPYGRLCGSLDETVFISFGKSLDDGNEVFESTRKEDAAEGQDRTLEARRQLLVDDEHGSGSWVEMAELKVSAQQSSEPVSKRSLRRMTSLAETPGSRGESGAHWEFVIQMSQRRRPSRPMSRWTRIVLGVAILVAEESISGIMHWSLSARRLRSYRSGRTRVPGIRRRRRREGQPRPKGRRRARQQRCTFSP